MSTAQKLASALRGGQKNMRSGAEPFVTNPDGSTTPVKAGSNMNQQMPIPQQPASPVATVGPQPNAAPPQPNVPQMPRVNGWEYYIHDRGKLSARKVEEEAPPATEDGAQPEQEAPVYKETRSHRIVIMGDKTYVYDKKGRPAGSEEDRDDFMPVHIKDDGDALPPSKEHEPNGMGLYVGDKDNGEPAYITYDQLVVGDEE